MNKDDVKKMSPNEFRQLARTGEWSTKTAGLCPGYVQSNLAVVPKEYAFDFFLFCYRNWQACSLIDVTEPGDPHPKLVAPEADLRTDLPRYRVFKDGELIDQPTDVTEYWRDDMVAFLIGCSWGFEGAMKAAKVQFRTLGDFTTNIPLVPAGPFSGYMAVSMRLFKSSHDAVRAVQISSRYTPEHGAPVYIGEPEDIGITDIYNADLYPHENVHPREKNEIAMFWGCGITPQLTAINAKLPIMLSHLGGHMLITDKLADELAVL
ncbi:MAG: DUF1445 domain-containing protein [Desulfobacteraceae bacterium]|nr:DUF1445 domain-containing protein [Desulfobacteraceae bacterium]